MDGVRPRHGWLLAASPVQWEHMRVVNAIAFGSIRQASRFAVWVALLAAWIEIAAATEADSPATYQGPCAVAVSRDGKVAYVANAHACEVAWVELDGGKVVRRVAMPGEPTGAVLVPDGSKLIVACAAPKSTIVVLDARSGQSLASIPAGHTATGPAVSPDGKRLYVCNRFSGDVSVIDLAAAKPVARVRAVREPIAAAVTPDGRTVLVANHLPNARTDDAHGGDVSPVVSVIDAQTLQTTSIELPHGATGVRGLCIAPDGKQAFVTHLLSNFQKIPFRVDMGWINVNVISIIDLAGRKVIRTTGMDEQDNGAANPWDVICTADGKMVCVSLSGIHQVCFIERSVLLSDAARSMSPMIVAWPIYPSLGATLWQRVPLPGKGPRGLAVSGSRVFAAQYFSDSLAVIDTKDKEHPGAGAVALGKTPPLTLERRGELLFNDATICYQRWQSCGSCHPDGRTDGLTWDLMNDGVGNAKSTKGMLLSHQTPPAMAEGVRMSAEEAVRSGIRNILFS